MHKVEETDKVMSEVEMVSQQYMPLSQACSSIYFTLEGLHQVSLLEMIAYSRAFSLFHSFLSANKLLKFSLFETKFIYDLIINLIIRLIKLLLSF